MKKSTPKKILIIGAGIAGLAANRHLSEHGFEVTILEARDRLGGRIWTNAMLGDPFSLGAAWIHGIDNNPMTLLAKRFHVEMAALDYQRIVSFDRHGQLVPPDVRQAFDEKFDLLLVHAKALANQSKTDMSLANALSSFIKQANFSPVEQDLFKRKQQFFAGYIGADYQFLSARHWDIEEAWPGENCFLINTYQPIIEGLSQNATIKLNTIVTDINIRANDVEVVAENAVYCADAVIITVPLGVLKNNCINFNPPLPADKQKAIDRLGMGMFNITVMKFPAPFWPQEHQMMFLTNLMIYLLLLFLISAISPSSLF